MRLGRLRLILLLLVVFVVSSFGVGCSNKTSGNDVSTGSGTSKATQTTTAAATEPYDSDTYPIKTDTKLTMWALVSADVTANFTNLDETEFSKEREKRTGIKVEYTLPAGKEALLVMMASNDLPDIIQMYGSTYPGGFSKLYADGVIIALNEVEQYSPNYFKVFKDNPSMDKLVKSNESKYYAYSQMFYEPTSEYGPFVRKDWLDKSGLGIPETVDDWYQMLKAFKEQHNATAPFTVSYPSEFFDASRFLVCAFGTSNSFFIRDCKVVYGPIEPQFKDYLTTIAKWYKEGLIDPDFTSLNRDVCNTKMITGEAGASANWASYMALYNREGQKTNPEYNIVPAPVVVLNKGDKAMLGYGVDLYATSNMGAVITKNSKNKELAARFMDWNYSEEGYMINNFGIEGTTYTVHSDGTIRFTDLVYNNPDGWSVGRVLAKWAGSSSPYVKHPQMVTAYAPDESLELFMQAFDKWAAPGYREHVMPPLEMSTEIQSEMNTIMSEINTYREEMSYRFLLGDLDINSNFDEFVSQVKKLRIDKVLENYQKAYEEFLKK